MKILFLLLIFSLPLGVLGRVWVGPNTFIYPHDIFAALILCSFLISLIKDRKISEKKLFIMTCIFLSIGLFSLLLSLRFLNLQTFTVAFAYLVRFAAYASILFSFDYLPKKFIKELPVYVSISGIIFTIGGYFQHFFYPSLKAFTVSGWDNHLYRLVATFLDPNFAGMYLVLVAAFILTSALSYQKQEKLLYIISFFFVIIAIFLTHSRAALLALLASGVVYLILAKQFRQIAAFIMVLLFGLLIFSNTNVEGLNPFRVVSSEARIETASNALHLFSKSPLFGVGFNAYRYAQVEYGLRESIGSARSNADAGSDNSFLFVLATTGIIGFLLYVDIWINFIKRIYQVTRFSTSLSKITVAAIVGLLVDSLFINSLFFPPIMVLIFILIGITLSTKRSARA